MICFAVLMLLWFIKDSVSLIFKIDGFLFVFKYFLST